jgi:prepilin-type N-terminal cleavage/methylation domain-containing protein
MPPDARRTGSAGFTLVELLVVIAIIGILATLSFRGLACVQERARIARAGAAVAVLEAGLTRYEAEHGALPGADAPADADVMPQVLRELGDGYARIEDDLLYVRDGNALRTATDDELCDRACDKLLIDPWHDACIARGNLSRTAKTPRMRRPDFMDVYSKGPNGRDDTLLLVRGAGDDDVGNW